MTKSLRTRVLTVVAVLAAAIFFAFPLQERINLGLDLKGGMHLILKVETETLKENARRDAVDRAIEILRNRIDSIGVGETVIAQQGQDQILLQLPGVTDREAALNMIGTVAQLDFYLVNNEAGDLKSALEGTIPPNYKLKYTKEDQTPILIEEQPALRGETIGDARVDFDTMGFGEPRIVLEFNKVGSKQFATITRENVGERMAIVLDGEVLSAPNINEPILNGSAEITGQFTYEEASELALALRSGALPAPMHIEEERTIGPLLGKDSIQAGIKATVIGGAAVLLFMLVYYFTAGIISDIALALNLLLIIGTMGFLNFMLPESQVTLTLPGIAGIILTLGMAVDANVLINERIREEIQNGRPIFAAISNGFNKAFKAIFDSNVTTLIAAFMLFQFGSGPIKGFAVTLSIGLLASLFTSFFVTRTLFMLLLELNLIKSLPMLRFFGESRIDFVGKRYFCFALSILVVVIGLTFFFKKGDAAFGIDFAGGRIQEYRFQQRVDSQQLRDTLNAHGITDAVIQQFAQHPENVIIRTNEECFDKSCAQEDGNDPISTALEAEFPDNAFELLRIERVGPIVGEALRRRAVLAIIWALGGILVFVGFRFKHFDFATAGVIALLHDVIVTLGLLVMMNRQIDLLVVTALLTIAGYSINDTIIVYDRVRENVAKMRKHSLRDIINASINQTLGRTILTTLTTLLVVSALYFLGGEVLNTFALCLMIGFIAGTYSTIFIATPLVLAWERKK